jgi:hypothetical protein
VRSERKRESNIPTNSSKVSYHHTPNISISSNISKTKDNISEMSEDNNYYKMDSKGKPIIPKALNLSANKKVKAQDDDVLMSPTNTQKKTNYAN